MIHEPSKEAPKKEYSAGEKVEHWDDERALGNSLIVTLLYGYSFSATEHKGVRGFDTIREAKAAIAAAVPCHCDLCQPKQ
jgi:hypothetical protein